MCVGISPPCSRCGAPARWRQMEAVWMEKSARLDLLRDVVTNQLSDDCPAKETLIRIIKGERSRG